MSQSNIVSSEISSFAILPKTLSINFGLMPVAGRLKVKCSDLIVSPFLINFNVTKLLLAFFYR